MRREYAASTGKMSPSATSAGASASGTPATNSLHCTGKKRPTPWYNQSSSDRRVVVTLNVSNDFALRSWILSFGALARVVAPLALAEEIQQEAARMGERYR